MAYLGTLVTGETFIVDDEDSPAVSALRWYRGGVWKPGRVGYAGTKVHGSWISMHRFITGYSGPLEIDHINGNPLDNRRENLRVCTRTQNLANRSKTRRVKFHSGRWVASTARGGVERSIGSFLTREEAEAAYVLDLKKEYGEFCRAPDPGITPVGWRDAARASGLHCRVCGSPFELLDTGRPRIYCSERCKDLARRPTKKGERHAQSTG